MHVLHVTPYYAPAWAYGGVARSVNGLATEQAVAGDTVTVLTTDALDREHRLEAGVEHLQGVTVHRVPNFSQNLRSGFNLSSPYSFGAAARKLMESEDFNIVHCHEFRTIENLLAVPTAHRLGLPIVLSPHGTLPYETGRRLAKQAWDLVVGRRLASRVDRVLVLTTKEAQQARRMWSDMGTPLEGRRVSVVPNGVHLPARPDAKPRKAFRCEWKLGTGPVVIFLGRLVRRKGLVLLLNAFASLADTIPDARLLIVGPDGGEQRHLRARIQHSELEGRVAITGLLTGKDLRAALAAADVFALPAHGEGFPMAALEALAAGLPVVLSADCGFDEVEDAGAGLIVPLDVPSLRDALSALLTSPAKRTDMSLRARQMAALNFAWPIITAKVKQVYEETISQRGQKTP